jgi:hypothetical protein
MELFRKLRRDGLRHEKDGLSDPDDPARRTYGTGPRSDASCRPKIKWATREAAERRAVDTSYDKSIIGLASMILIIQSLYNYFTGGWLRVFGLDHKSPGKREV